MGGESAGNSDAIYFANYATRQGVSVTFSGDEAGTLDFIDPGANAIGSFTEIEGIAGKVYSDVIDASSSSADQEIVALWGADTVIGGCGDNVLQEIAEVMPQVPNCDQCPEFSIARPVVARPMLRTFIARHRKNQQPVFH